MPRITISYRRDDSLDITGRIFDRLAAHFGREAVFRDIDNIPLGVDFRRHIDGVLGQSDIILAIVGPRWIGPRASQSRLASAADPVRLEIETALKKGKPLIPVLVSRAAMPHPDQLPESLHDFAFRNAIQVDAGQDFDVHIGRLIRGMDELLQNDTAPAASAGDDAVLDRGVPALPEADLSAEIAALRDANRALEAQVAALTDTGSEQARRAAVSSEEAAIELHGKEREVSALTQELSAERELSAAQGRRIAEMGAELDKRQSRVEALSAARALSRPRNLILYRAGLAVLLTALAGTAISLGVVAQRPASEQVAQRDAKISSLQDQLVQAQQTRVAQKVADDKALATEQDNSRAARARADQLNAQVQSLRDQSAQSESARTAAEAKVAARDTQIAELGKKLDGAVARVQELERATRQISAAPMAAPSVGPASNPARQSDTGIIVANTPNRRGILVTKVNGSSPAEIAGIQPGDVIQSVNGLDMTDITQFAGAVGRSQRGGTITLYVERGKNYILSLVLHV